jgi:hypothetical protein
MHDQSDNSESPEAVPNLSAADSPAHGQETMSSTEGGSKPKRFTNALLIVDPGACNPSGIAYAIIEACQEARAEGIGTKDDVAVRLMVTQLAWVCRADSDADDYGELLAACRRLAAAE